ncbi:MAG: PQQ-binding-like beta-propeller repeat protein [Planctomycetota bacterium]|nr:PQQ-binding-like beta-propeller repeat protein [Planctomycetota bacterium]
MAFRERPDSAGFHGRLVVFATGDNLTAVDKETGAVRWRRTLPFAADLIAGDDRAFVVGHSSPEAPVMALSPETGEVLWYRWFGQEARFTGRRLRGLAVSGEGGAPPVLRLYWGEALFAREGPRPAEVLVEVASGAIRDVRLFLPQEPAWPARIYFGDDYRTRTAPEAGIPWPYRGPFRPDAVAYLGKDKVARFALRESGADLAGGWNPQAEASIEAARRWTGLYATPGGAYVKRLGQLAFFDAQAKREILLALPRTGDRENGFAIGDFREGPGDQLTVVSVPPGRPDETAAGEAPAGPDDGSNIVFLKVSEFTKTGLRDDLGNGDVTLTYYGSGTGSQVRIQSRNLPEAGANLVATLLNGVTREHYRAQPVKMTGLSSLGWAKYDVFLYGDTVKGPVTINGGTPQANQGADFKTPAHRTTFIRNVNYVKFEGVSGDSFIVDFNGDFSAIQVVDASGRMGPRGSLGVRWTGRGPVLGPDDMVGAEFAAGSWYNIVTDYPRKKVFALSGGCQTIGRGLKRRLDPRRAFVLPGPDQPAVAGKKVLGFVDVFDRKTGQVLNSLPLPAGEAPASRTGCDGQAKLLDDALLVTDGHGVYFFRSGPEGTKP